MKLTQFAAIIENYTPDGFTFWAGHARGNYNMTKDVSDTLLLVLPNPYPSMYRDECWHQVEFELWLGKLIEIKRTTEGTQEHRPYSSFETRQEVYDIADSMLYEMKQDDKLQLVTVNPMVFHDSPDGESVNRQVWLQIPVTAKIWMTNDEFDYTFNFDLQ